MNITDTDITNINITHINMELPYFTKFKFAHPLNFWRGKIGTFMENIIVNLQANNFKIIEQPNGILFDNGENKVTYIDENDDIQILIFALKWIKNDADDFRSLVRNKQYFTEENHIMQIMIDDETFYDFRSSTHYIITKILSNILENYKEQLAAGCKLERREFKFEDEE